MTGLQKNKEDTGSLTNVRKLVLKFAAMVLFAIPAAADPRYEADVNVDVTAATVTEAKKQAMAKAVRDGLNEVVLSISTAQSADEINKLNDNQLQHFVSGIMVLMEKSSDVRYIADLRISVNEDILKAYLAENNMPLVAGEEQDVLAVPLLEKKTGRWIYGAMKISGGRLFSRDEISARVIWLFAILRKIWAILPRLKPIGFMT